MATGQVNSTYDVYDSNSNRETLSDLIDTITPAETPFYSEIGEETVTGVKPTWQTDQLGIPDLDNAHVDGEIYQYDTIQQTSRVSNSTQIFRKSVIISDTQEAVEKAGKTSDVAYEKARMGQEIKIDIEVAFLSNQASSAGSSAIPRRLGGLRAWIKTNDSIGAGGASGGYNVGTGNVDAAINGTQRAFTRAILDEMISGTYVAGGNPDMLMCSPYVKRVFSSFINDAGTAQLRYPVKPTGQATIVGAADMYQSDYGLIEVVPNRQMARLPELARNAFLIDRSKVKKGWLRSRKIHEDKGVARVSDGEPTVMIGEVTLMVTNEAAHGVAADLFGIGATA